MLSIVIPAHNEEARISPTLDAYGRFFSQKKAAREIDDVEILVVNAASTDHSLDILKDYVRRYPDVGYLDLAKSGKGYAIIQGITRCRGDIVGFVDADMSTSPEAFYDLYRNLDDYDGIIGSRWLRGSRTERSLGKFIRSRTFNCLVRALFRLPYRDTQCGAKILRKDKILPFIGEVSSLQWVFDVDLLYLCRRHGLRIREHPTVWTDRKGSKIEIKAPLLMAAEVVRLRLAYSPLRFLVRTGKTPSE
jgi:glycosyltransferase involved in cell wall biosynthesis